MITVFGDVMLDRYIVGTAEQVSAEAPVPVVKVTQEYSRPGGAANVAMNLAALGCEVRLFGTAGYDEEEIILRDQLASAKIGTSLVCRKTLQTIRKTRIVAGHHQQIVRIDRESRWTQYADVAAEHMPYVERAVSNSTAVVISDYDKGTISGPLAELIVKRCWEMNTPCIVASKAANLLKYVKGPYFVCNRAELGRIELPGYPPRNPSTHVDIVARASHVMHQHRFRGVLVTKGEHGMTWVDPEKDIDTCLPAHQVVDVCGAGDTVTAVLAQSIADKFPINTACRRAAAAAGVAVRRVGTHAVTKDELDEALKTCS
jgi:D-beta-D-heptose 7-phosphate kinase/D-beta-D-heptose 1-phosphate adenosyltransferase